MLRAVWYSLLFLLAAGIVVTLAAWDTSAIPHYLEYEQVCGEERQSAGKDRTAYNTILVSLRHIRECANANEGLILGLATIFIAFFTGTLWRATDKLVRGAEDTAQRQLRAYVFVSQLREIQWANDRLVVNLEIGNAGETPAYKLRRWTSIGLRDASDSDRRRFREIARKAHEVIKPKAVVHKGINLDAVAERETTEAEVKLIDEGKKVIWVWGEVRYSDAFNKWHTTRFCYWVTGSDWRAPKGLRLANYGNTAN